MNQKKNILYKETYMSTCGLKYVDDDCDKDFQKVYIS